MGRRPASAPLTVAINGRRVGELRREPSGAIRFAYHPDWLDWDGAFPISVSLPLREDAVQGEPVVAYFDNLLPDERTVRTRLAERAGADGTDAWSLLAAVGRDCVGALQFLPPDEEPSPPGPPQVEPLDDEAVAALIRNLAAAPLGVDPENDFRISIAGAQEKTALLRRNGRWFRPLGATPTTHILKPQIGWTGDVDLSRSVENEHLCMRLAAAFGLPVARTEIVDVAGVRVLAVERFDRRETADGRLMRLPQEDLCQALGVPSTRKYEAAGGPGPLAAMKLLGGSDDPFRDRLAFLKALALFWLLGATDGHAKNFSLRMGRGGYALAPLYDILSLQPAVDAGQLDRGRFKLSMALGDSRHYVVQKVQPRHLVQTARAGGIRGRFIIGALEELRERSDHALDALSGEIGAGLPAEVVDPVAAGVRSRAELIGEYLQKGASEDFS